jgi:hypothetical protein
VKPESKFWQLVKKNTPQIQWTRLESWASFGVPDLLGYNNKCGFFMCELKVARGKKISFSPHQKVKADAPRAVKLYESSQMEELLTMGHAARPLVQDDWNAIQEALIAGL